MLIFASVCLLLFKFACAELSWAEWDQSIFFINDMWRLISISKPDWNDMEIVALVWLPTCFFPNLFLPMLSFLTSSPTLTYSHYSSDILPPTAPPLSHLPHCLYLFFTSNLSWVYFPLPTLTLPPYPSFSTSNLSWFPFKEVRVTFPLRVNHFKCGTVNSGQQRTRNSNELTTAINSHRKGLATTTN